MTQYVTGSLDGESAAGHEREESMTGGEPRADGGATGDGKTGIGVDVGGTFTDVALSVDDRLVTAKVPTTDDQHVGVLEGIDKARPRRITPSEIDGFAHAMTVSVNALLERDGAKTALVTTEGFRDVPEIGRRTDPTLRSRGREARPAGPRESCGSVDERATTGYVERPVDADAVRDIAATLREREVEAVAVCLLRAYAAPDNESRSSPRRLREELAVPISASHEVLAEFREFERTSTTAADAYPDRRSTAASADWSKPTRRGSRHRGSCRPTAASPTRRWSASAP